MKPIVLCILDGVGIRKEEHGNAFKKAKKPVFDWLWNTYPHTLLEASGEYVGLPAGQMGNSEVGHMNIGAGRVVYQPLGLISKSIQDGTICQNDRILEVIEHTKQNHSKLHVLGLLSDGGIHSHIEHLFGILDMIKKQGVEELYIHVITDGRDTLPNVAGIYIESLEEKLKEIGIGTIATIAGRYYTMDRDNRYDRVKKAYQAMCEGKGHYYQSAKDALLSNYKNGVQDEFIVPSIIDLKGQIQDNDGILIFNYRPDRLREIGSAFTNPNFNGFAREPLQNIKLVTMMPVSEEVLSYPAYQLEELKDTFGEYISEQGCTQLRIAETEKYAHVTYFFDGGEEKKLEGCTRILIPSPKVATYDLKPEMSAWEITTTLVQELDKKIYDVVILNYANGDMVGHTGVMEAAIKAVETLDRCLGILYDKVKELGGILIVTADHGNCDTMLDAQDRVVTSHSTEPVPFIITEKGITLENGKLGDIAPTMLSLLNLSIPKSMTGKNLIYKEKEN